LIACNGGQIVHAELGPLQGEEAIYELLSWTEGNFRLTDNPVQTPQTINASWSAVLMEGMRRLDERRANESVVTLPAITPDDIAKDSEFEGKLIVLFSCFDQSLVRLAAKETQKDIPLALRTLAELVNQAAQFSESEFWVDEARYAEKGSSAMGALLSEIEITFPLARLLQTQRNRLSIASISKLYSTMDGDPIRRRENLYQITSAMVSMLEHYFTRFLTKLRTPQVRQECQDVVDTFLADLTKLVDKLAY
jgi:hypothetical protein